jgi:hypothetical protein
MKTLEQQRAWDKLQQTLKNGLYRPGKYGTIPPSLNDAKQYDTPRNLKDWSQDKRKVVSQWLG